MEAQKLGGNSRRMGDLRFFLTCAGEQRRKVARSGLRRPGETRGTWAQPAERRHDRLPRLYLRSRFCQAQIFSWAVQVSLGWSYQRGQVWKLRGGCWLVGQAKGSSAFETRHKHQLNHHLFSLSVDTSSSAASLKPSLLFLVVLHIVCCPPHFPLFPYHIHRKSSVVISTWLVHVSSP